MKKICGFWGNDIDEKESNNEKENSIIEIDSDEDENNIIEEISE